MAVALTGCASRSSDASGGANEDQSSVAMGNTGNAASAPAHMANKVAAGAAASGGGAPGVQQRAVISTGTIELVSTDVATTRTRLDAVVSRLGGHIADENTSTDDHGTVTRSHLVVRVPSGRFDQAMTGLADAASLRSSTRQAQDVTTRVIDIKARIAAERAGVRRLRQLVSHTASLRALLDVERALTERQGELESLSQQQAYLSDQTTQATITVDVSRKVTPAVVHKATGGFVGGLRHGWHGLVTVVVGFLVGLGAALPFAVVALVIGLPAWVVARRMLRTRRLRAPVES
jgi:hypothetical protein